MKTFFFKRILRAIHGFRRLKPSMRFLSTAHGVVEPSNIERDNPARYALNQLPFGVFILDEQQRIVEWNAWLADKTRIARDNALGKTLSDCFPGFDHSRFKTALEMVFTDLTPQLLSHAFNHYVIPIPLKWVNHFGLAMMQQKVHISPLKTDNGHLMALITIVDVTDNVVQQLALKDATTHLQENQDRDPLTNVYNRRFLHNWLEKNLLAAKRHSYSVACLMIDIDHFKCINDAYGHRVGDLVLQRFGEMLVHFIRESDVCVRYGGDEFLLFLSWSTLTDAVERAWCFVKQVRQTSIGGLAPGAVTCSIGASVFLSESPCTQHSLITQADLKLYKAKREGRDRVWSDC